METFTDNACSNVDYSSGLSTACGACLDINPLLTFMINGNRIYTHELSNWEATAQLESDWAVKVLEAAH